MQKLTNHRSLFKHVCIVIITMAYSLISTAQEPDYAEGWYQIKRTINISSFADIDFTNISAASSITSLMTDISYLKTADEFTTGVTLPTLNINLGTAVYGACLLSVDGTKDASADLTSRNTNEKEISTYYYITPVAADADGEWSYTVRSANGHYMGPDGRYYAEPKQVYFNSSIGISLGDTADAILKPLLSSLGVGIGSKQYSLSADFINDIPYIDQLEIYSQIKPLLEAFGTMGIKVSENSWVKKTLQVANGDDTEEIAYISSPNILETLSSIADDATDILQYYNDQDYTSIGKLLVKYVGFDMFKLKKINLDKVVTATGLITTTRTKLTPYTVNLIGFGDNFTLNTSDYLTADLLTKLSQKTNQNAMVNYTGSGAQALSLTNLYSGGTLFIKDKGSVGNGSEVFELTTTGTDLVDLSRAQTQVLIDDTNHVIDIILSSPKQTTIAGIATGRWTDNYKTVTTDAAGLATISSPFELTIPTDEKGLLGNIRKHAPKAYVATDINGNDVICRQLTDVIPANTPVILLGDAKQSYNFTVVEADATTGEPVSDNILSSTYTEKAIAEGIKAYTLTYSTSDNTTPIFSVLSDDSRTVSAWQAYLVSSDINAPESYTVILDTSSSSIRDITVSQDEGETVIYNLSGQRLPSSATLAPGIYIINGKKTCILH